ncbi:MAG: hypothetical protein M3Y58_08475 [Chloroflexota bacterium]|nr:hypothetical protein [Chloroflexota bacterium]
MADYTDSVTASAYIGGASLTGGDVSTLSAIITACSRAFDRATERANNFWAAQTAVTRRYSGSGNQWLDIDDWDTITAVTMSTTQNRSDATAVALPIGGVPQSPDYAEVYPLTGPPFSQLFLLRTWYPDAYGIGNVAVTGNTILPPEIADAVALWVAYRWKRMKTNFADRVSIANGPALQWSGMPPDVQQVIDQYKAERPMIVMPRDPRTQSPRLSPLGGQMRVLVPGTLGNS